VFRYSQRLLQLLSLSPGITGVPMAAPGAAPGGETDDAWRTKVRLFVCLWKWVVMKLWGFGAVRRAKNIRCSFRLKFDKHSALDRHGIDKLCLRPYKIN